MDVIQYTASFGGVTLHTLTNNIATGNTSGFLDLFTVAFRDAAS